MNLRLVVLKFENHLFKLFAALFKILLVDLELLSDFWATLLRQNVLKLNVQFLLFLDKNVFLRHLFCLGNQPLLQTLNLLYQLISLNIS
jgi:hypothetical protein